MTEQKKIILLDLDGVLNKYNGEYIKGYIPPIKEGALEFVKELANKYDIKLFTTREKILASMWLVENNIHEYIKEVTNVKEPAWLIIDDRCIRYDGDFEKIIKNIENFEVWYKKE